MHTWIEFKCIESGKYWGSVQKTLHSLHVSTHYRMSTTSGTLKIINK